LPAITIILPISREQHLLKVLASLELLECERDRTSLLWHSTMATPISS
jgi:hypothetical protein